MNHVESRQFRQVTFDQNVDLREENRAYLALLCIDNQLNTFIFVRRFTWVHGLDCSLHLHVITGWNITHANCQYTFLGGKALLIPSQKCVMRISTVDPYQDCINPISNPVINSMWTSTGAGGENTDTCGCTCNCVARIVKLNGVQQPSGHWGCGFEDRAPPLHASVITSCHMETRQHSQPQSTHIILYVTSETSVNRTLHQSARQTD